ncbi:HD-GYP domain-containing protein [Comamonas flocculans]|uniref:HD domain-containing protein n=1 Tax=Comamonas flocculans TaxID=2597701 RepID=A0A5B8RZ23_9BURK|nr:HD domain-containing phosphohydrolase [Comamonas flocculans]QEA14018.1 HD domain-containing protein [Comamonas flocculans]
MVTTAAPAAAHPDEPVWEPTHYQRAILAVCERRRVSTAKAVFSRSGLKLVEAGVQLGADNYRRLMQHELRKPLEELLTMDGLVSPASLVEFARELCQREPLLELLTQDGSEGVAAGALLVPLQAMVLPPQLAFMLSVLREQHPAHFAHAVHVALVAAYFAIRANWTRGECTNAATAGLLHDLGTLLMDPVWLDGSRPVSGAERSELMRHPLASARLVSTCEVYPRSLAVAILEHHERMDGSGYPRGLQGAQISAMGQLLLLAEVVAAFFEKYATDGAAVRLSLTLRLGHHKFPAEFTTLLLPLLQASNIQRGEPEDLAQVREAAAQISQAMALWQQLHAGLQQAGVADEPGSAQAYVAQRLHALQRSLYDAGCHPDQQEELIALLHDDAQGLKEMLFLVREALWQLRSIAHTSGTRWPLAESAGSAGEAAVQQWCAALESAAGAQA